MATFNWTPKAPTMNGLYFARIIDGVSDKVHTEVVKIHLGYAVYNGKQYLPEDPMFAGWSEKPINVPSPANFQGREFYAS